MVRFFDVMVSLMLLMLLLPLFLITGLLIKLNTKGPVFYRDLRVGYNKTIFLMFKFRSMSLNQQSSDNWSTQKNDSRITSVGFFLRKSSIDELPQLINVLLGQMSIVGPRPESPRSESVYTKKYWDEVHEIRPGITGLAQVNGRSNLTLDKKIEFDLIYKDKIVQLSGLSQFFYNIKIIFSTILVVLFKKGTN